MYKFRVLSMFLALTLVLTMISGIRVTAVDELPALPDSCDYVIRNALKLTNATDTITTTQAKTGKRLTAEMVQTEFDISQYDYLYLWIYVSDADILYDNNGDGLELASGGQHDNEENALFFYYNKASVPTINDNYGRLQTGWNEYLLKISDFKTSTGGVLDETALDYIGLVLRSNPAGLTFAMSEIYAVREEDVSMTSIGTFPSNSGIPAIPLADARYQIANTSLQLTQNVAYNTATGANQYFRLMPTLTASELDISNYDFIYLWVYVAYNDLTNGDSIELCSGGAQDAEESAARFNSLSQGNLQVGWNELLIPVSEFSYDAGGGLNETKLDFIGVVLRSVTQTQTGAISTIHAVKSADVTDTACPITEEIPTDMARYTLQESALQLTTEKVWGAESDGYMRLVPTLTQSSFDLSEYDYIYTWIYLTADDLHNGDSIELCSGGT